MFIMGTGLAHEIYYNTSTSSGIPLSFSDANLNSTDSPYLKVYPDFNNTTSGQTYDSLYYLAVNQWIGYYGGSMYITVDYLENSTGCNIRLRNSVDYYAFYNVSSDVLGFTIIIDTNNNTVNSVSTALSSTKKIKRANIFLNPDVTVFYVGTDDTAIRKQRIRKTITHEVGHAMGLGHPDNTFYSPIGSSVYSIMRHGFPDTYTNIGTSPATHDKNDLYDKYINHLVL